MTPLPRVLWEDLLFLPFRAGARGPDAYDCWGLVLEIYRRMGTPLPAIPTPRDQRDIDAAISDFLPRWGRCDVSPGVVLLFREEGIPRHVGVAVDDDLFIHAAAATGQVCLDRLSRPWGRLLVSAYRHIQS